MVADGGGRLATFTKAHREEQEIPMEHELKTRSESRKGWAEDEWRQQQREERLNQQIWTSQMTCYEMDATWKDFEASNGTPCWQLAVFKNMVFLYIADRTRF